MLTEKPLDKVLADTRMRVLHELGTIEASLTLLRQRQDALRGTLRGLDVALGIDDDQPKGAEAVAIVAIEAIERGGDEGYDGALTVAEIVEELRRRHWMPDSEKPEGAVRAAIRRLRERDPHWGLYQGRLYYHDFQHPMDSEGEEESK